MKNKGLFFTIFISLMLLLAACGTSDTEQNTQEDTDQNSQQADDNETASTHWNEIEEAGEIVVGTSGTLYPASFYPEESEELTGYDIEIIKEVANRLGLEIKYETMAVDGMLASLNNGRVDLVINDMEITEERKKQFSFSDPYKYSYTTMIVRAEDHSGIETLEDLDGKKAGGGATTVFSQIAEHYGAEVVTYGNATNDTYLRDVDNGRTDTVINDYYLQSLALKAFPEFDIVLHPDLKFHPTEQAIVMPLESNVLNEKINETLAEMREDGTLTELSEQFFGGKDASKQPEEDIVEIEGLDL
ncbi:transporter substrate-binding domain-containing protein [Aquibacillus koreensis]|uniref:Transporter substrate-binding domain-containing protein n=1 Tax=Aquibacillus koreensis TaxID=279446 RepID=A0A9X3WL18_9BACI|nr:transporter substrate-binding domain-containing protein [Aquibacillus koreensis]MCT2534435.1 transporter substrate-binding domain-containing protein [Aquibacillus koreensis]MDC3421742.1 transporter substrate-binding domain-containing protein [Aquibacillus koreensis]